MILGGKKGKLLIRLPDFTLIFKLRNLSNKVFKEILIKTLRKEKF